MYSATVQYCWVNVDSPVYVVLNEIVVSGAGLFYSKIDTGLLKGLYSADASRIISALPQNFVKGAPYNLCMCVVRNEDGVIIPAISTFFLAYARQRTSYALLLSSQQ